MPNLFGLDIAGIIAKSMGPGLLPVSGQAPTYGARDPDDLTAGPVPGVPVSWTARGFIEDWSVGTIDGDIIQVGDRRITILGATIKPALVPEVGWRVTIEGDTYLVVAPITRDPAAATYTMNARR